MNSMDNFNMHSKSKPYTHCKCTLINFDCTRWQYVLSAYHSVRLDRELTVHFLYFSNCMFTDWYHKLQKRSKRAASVTLLFLLPLLSQILWLHFFALPELLFQQTVLKDLAKTLCLTHTTCFFSLLHPILVAPSVHATIQKVKVSEEHKKKALPKYFILKK